MENFEKYNKIFNNWNITKLIGNGSFGKVFELHRADDKSYKSAMKVITIPQNESAGKLMNVLSGQFR